MEACAHQLLNALLSAFIVCETLRANRNKIGFRTRRKKRYCRAKTHAAARMLLTGITPQKSIRVFGRPVPHAPETLTSVLNTQNSALKSGLLGKRHPGGSSRWGKPGAFRTPGGGTSGDFAHRQESLHQTLIGARCVTMMGQQACRGCAATVPAGVPVARLSLPVWATPGTGGATECRGRPCVAALQRSATWASPVRTMVGFTKPGKRRPTLAAQVTRTVFAAWFTLMFVTPTPMW